MGTSKYVKIFIRICNVYFTYVFIVQAWEARVAVRMELFEMSLCDKSQLIQIKRCMEIGLLCVETDRTDRPTMEEVLAMLNGEKGLPALKRPFGVHKPYLTDYLCF